MISVDSDMRLADAPLLQEEPPLVVYGRRWYILASLTALSLSQAMMWNIYGPIAGPVPAARAPRTSCSASRRKRRVVSPRAAAVVR